ncbi:MAG: Fic family protein [Verrucomicrobiaceae bacterium]|nr:Fic family protein [Verrucomicrobiaceae bacterium]
MRWNWEEPDWPDFIYEASRFRESEERFLHGSGLLAGVFLHLDEEDGEKIRVGLLSDEALETSRIEGEILDRESLQSSVRHHFGLPTESRRVSPAERGVAALMVDVCLNFADDLTDARLGHWHGVLMQGQTGLREVGRYRSQGDPMRIVSGPIHAPNVHFEAPPATRVPGEMRRFLEWFNGSGRRIPALTRSALAHLHFESIHPFEDGNGRIGRAIAELSLSQSIGKPVLLALSQTIRRHQRVYYEQLASGSRALDVEEWIAFFSEIVLEAQDRAGRQIEFLLQKARFFDRYRGSLNARQEKVLLRMFEAGIDGFTGGLSAGNYIRIAKTSSSTATRDLQDLVARGALRKTGDRKYARYHLT